MMRARLPIAVVAALLVCAPLFADWADDYEAGLKAASRKDWSTVAAKMDAAIANEPEEGRHRIYGAVFLDYYPYYYRGIARYELGDYRGAKSDLGRTKGVGKVNLGSADSYIRKADDNLKPTPTPVRETPTPARETPTPARETPTPARETPTPGRETPTPVRETPTPFVGTTSVRESRARAQTTLNQAGDRRAAALQQQANAIAPQDFSRGMASLSRAQSLAATADTAAQWNAVADAAESARVNFDLAIGKVPKFGNIETRKRVRSAVGAYFDGQFVDAAGQFERLAGEQSNNALLWAFYGASLYSSYYIDGERDPVMRSAAENAFRRAKALRLRELPSNYFSTRIRRVYANVR